MAVETPIGAGDGEPPRTCSRFGPETCEAVDCVACNFIGQARELDMWNTSVIH